jgi:hypothetical protein
MFVPCSSRRCRRLPAGAGAGGSRRPQGLSRVRVLVPSVGWMTDALTRGGFDICPANRSGRRRSPERQQADSGHGQVEHDKAAINQTTYSVGISRARAPQPSRSRPRRRPRRGNPHQPRHEARGSDAPDDGDRHANGIGKVDDERLESPRRPQQCDRHEHDADDPAERHLETGTRRGTAPSRNDPRRRPRSRTPAHADDQGRPRVAPIPSPGRGRRRRIRRAARRPPGPTSPVPSTSIATSRPVRNVPSPRVR